MLLLANESERLCGEHGRRDSQLTRRLRGLLQQELLQMARERTKMTLTV